jgi:REP element-mobilizing transposase RayT
MTPIRKPHTPSPAASAAGKIKATHKVRSGPLFLTCTTHKRIPLFRYRRPCNIFLESLAFYRGKYELKLHGYVIMPNHFHLLLHFPAHYNFGNFLREIKGATAKQILDWAKKRSYTKLLARLRHDKQQKRRKGSRYSVWQRNSYATAILNPAMARTRLNYIHENPCRQKLVTMPEDFPWSSAMNYSGKSKAPFQVDLLEL